MPNGYDKNWIRINLTINGFRGKFKSWPTKITLDDLILRDLRDNLFTSESLAKIEEKLELIPIDKGMIVAEDDKGRVGADR